MEDGSVVLCFEEGVASSVPFGEEQSGGGQFSLEVPGWPQRSCGRGPVEFVSVSDHEATLAQMLLSHQGADFCLVGGKVPVYRVLLKLVFLVWESGHTQ